jgi:hypothetical protein
VTLPSLPDLMMLCWYKSGRLGKVTFYIVIGSFVLIVSVVGACGACYEIRYCLIIVSIHLRSIVKIIIIILLITMSVYHTYWCDIWKAHSDFAKSPRFDDAMLILFNAGKTLSLITSSLYTTNSPGIKSANPHNWKTNINKIVSSPNNWTNW